MCKYRMYSLVLRQLSPIQKGVQTAHSVIEYANQFHKLTEYIQWSKVDKTLIILDGGTYQEMRECRNVLDELKVPYAVFYEEDLGNLMTSITFIVEDKVFDSKEYPYEIIDESSDSDMPAWLIEMGGIRNLKFRNFIKSKKLSM